MKKLITIVALTLLTLLTNAQDFKMNVYKVKVHTYNVIKDDWELQRETKPTGMYLEKRGNVIIISNQNESNYRLGKLLNSDNKECIIFTATDKDNKDCGLQICLLSDNEQLAMVNVLYVDVMLVTYYISPNKNYQLN